RDRNVTGVQTCALPISNRRGVLEFRNKEPVIDVRDCLLDQLIAVKLHRVSILVIDLLPERLELLFGKVLVQRILLHLGFVAVGRSEERRVGSGGSGTWA